MLIALDTTPTQVKRLAANIHRAAGRMRDLLIELASATYGNRSTPEICDIREIIAAASEAAAAAVSSDLARCARADKVAAGALSHEADVL